MIETKPRINRMRQLWTAVSSWLALVSTVEHSKKVEHQCELSGLPNTDPAYACSIFVVRFLAYCLLLFYRCSHPCWNVICTTMIRYKISSLTGCLVQTPWRSQCYQTKPVGENKEVDKICCCVLLTRVYFKKIFLINFKKSNIWKMADTLISRIFVTGIYGIRDIWSKHYRDTGY